MSTIFLGGQFMEILKKQPETPEQNYPEVMTIAQVARYLGCSERHCHTLVKNGILPSFLIGNLRRFRLDSVRAVLSQLEHGNH
jgi:excisionase family DNA binding protein